MCRPGEGHEVKGGGSFFSQPGGRGPGLCARPAEPGTVDVSSSWRFRRKVCWGNRDPRGRLPFGFPTARPISERAQTWQVREILVDPAKQAPNSRVLGCLGAWRPFWVPQCGRPRLSWRPMAAGSGSMLGNLLSSQSQTFQGVWEVIPQEDIASLVQDALGSENRSSCAFQNPPRIA